MADERTVYHLQLFNKSDRDNDLHSYYGSLKALCNENDKSLIGITYPSLRNNFMGNAVMYQNAKCIIRKGSLKQVESNRGKYERIKKQDI